jgi:hypothetical protein
MRRWLAWGLLLSLGLVGGGYLWATLGMAGLEAFRSPLRDSPPPVVAPTNTALSGRVVMVIVDGLRVDTAANAAVMPTLASLRAQAAQAEMHSRPFSYSLPGYATLLTGAWPDLNSGPPINLETEDIPTLTQETIFSSASRAGLRTAAAGYAWFGRLIPAGQLSDSFFTPGDDQAADRAVVDAAIPWLRAGRDQLVLIHIDQVDYAGHQEGGPNDLRWNQAAARADGLLGEILAELDLSRDTVLVVSDHGHIDTGGHGGSEAITLHEPFVLAGKGVTSGNYSTVEMVDVAPTVAALLGMGLPSTTQGQPLAEMLQLSGQQRSALQTAWEGQQARVADDYRAAIGMKPLAWSDETPGAEGISKAQAARLSRERIPRAILSFLAALALARLVFGSLPRAGLRLGASLVYLAVFSLGYLLVSQRTFSFSSVRSQNDLLLVTAAWTLAGLLAASGLYAGLSRLRLGRAEETGAGLLSLLITIAYLLLLVVLVDYSLNGAMASWMVPEPIGTFLGLLASVQGLYVGLAGVLVAAYGLASTPRQAPAGR